MNYEVKRDLDEFIRSHGKLRTVHDNLFEHPSYKPIGVPPQKAKPNQNPISSGKTVKQDQPQSETDLEKSINKFLDGQRISNMFVKNLINDLNLKMKQNEKNY